MTVCSAFPNPSEGEAGETADTAAPLEPMLIVATAGGGIRAAYWTAAVLDTLGTDPGVARAPICSP